MAMSESPSSVAVVLFSSASAVSFLLYDSAITLDNEIKYIWSKPKSAWIKWQYLFIRYFAISAQIINRIVQFNLLRTPHLNLTSLRNWFISQVIVGNLLMTAVEFVLVVRVYALYDRARWLLYAFICLFLAEAATIIIGIRNTIPNQFNANLLLLSVPKSFAYFGIAAAVSQCTIVLLTLFKYFKAVRGGWSEIPIMVLVIRDGTAAFTILFVCCTATVIATVSGSNYVPISYVWLISITSSAGCRLIINMQSLAVEPLLSTLEPSYQLTTFLPGTEGSSGGDRADITE